MSRKIMALAALVVLAGIPPGAEAKTAPKTEAECTVYCAIKAVQRCDDVSSTWCNAYIVGCLAGCGISYL